jgi:hypothetical protein
MEVMISFTPRPLYPQGKSPWYPLDRLSGPQSRSGRCGEVKNSQPPPGIEPWNLDRPPCSPALIFFYCRFQIYELCYIFERYISYVYVTILPRILVTRHGAHPWTSLRLLLYQSSLPVSNTARVFLHTLPTQHSVKGPNKSNPEHVS